MTTTATETDLGFGLGIAFSILALASALGTVYFGYSAALAHGSSEAAQFNSGIAFTVAVLAGVIAVGAFHAYDS